MKKILQFVLPALFFAGMSFVLSPFQYDDGNSGRYLLPVLKEVDAGLFMDDAQVESLGKFSSGFYRLLSAVLVDIQLDPRQIESFMAGLYFVSRFLFALALMYLAWKMGDNESERWLLTLVLSTWLLFPIGLALAGVAISNPTMNHSRASEIVMVVSFALLASRKVLPLTILNAADVWVHPLMAVHRIGAFAPTLCARIRDRWGAIRLFGILGVFAVSVAAYWIILAPPTLGEGEVEILVAAKGRMVHNSPFVQSVSAWLSFFSLGAIAWFATKRFTRGFEDHRIQDVWWAIGAGAAIAFILSAVSHASQMPFLIRLQPMRMFIVPWFGCIVLVAVGASRAFLTRDASWPWLAAVVGTSLLHGGISILVMPLCAVVLLVSPTGVSLTRTWARSRIALGGVVIVGLAMALGSGRSLHFLLGVLVVASILALSFLTKAPKLVASMLCVVLVCFGAVSSWVYFCVEPSRSTGRPRVDKDYRRTLEWIRDNTPRDSRFATEPGMAFFRTRSLRTSVNETIPAVVWVDPFQYRDSKEKAGMVDALFQEGGKSQEEVEAISRLYGFKYVVARESVFPPFQLIFSSGPFHVFRVR